jgi:NADH dehydrogenase [ubiquinone] 1 alpha subcomplex assembly factor 7
MPPGEASVLPRLRAAAEADGFLPFDRFEAIALYAPGAGYYRRADSAFGPRGDFYTAPHTGPLLGELLADRAIAHVERAGRPARFVVAELGPGDGRLAASALPELGRRAPPGQELEYVLVAPDDPERARALERARSASQGAVPVRAVGALAELGLFAGTVLANEVFDALPARRFRRGADGWEELGVRELSGRFVEAARPVPPAHRPPFLPPEAQEGSTFELAPLALALVRQLADQILAGGAIVLDYGDTESRWTGRSSSGTLTAVRGHALVADAYERPGETDLSVFVNFDRLRTAGRRAGLEETAFGRQAEVLAGWGLADRAAKWIDDADSAPERVRRQLAVKNLSFGFENFRVLEWTVPAR